MKPLYAIALFALMLVAISFAQGKEGTTEISKNQLVPCLTVEVLGNKNSVEKVLEDKFKTANGKPKGYDKGFTQVLQVNLSDFHSSPLDYYYKVEKKDSSHTIITWCMSMGPSQFVSSQTDKSLMDKAGNYLTGKFQKDVKVYELQVAIELQEKILKDATKKYEDMVQKGKDLEKEKEEILKSIEENKKNQEDGKKMMEGEGKRLEDLKSILSKEK